LSTYWTFTAYLALADVIPSGQKLFKHRNSLDPPLCGACGLLDRTAHRAKYCHGSQNINELLIQRLRLQVNPDQLLNERLNSNGEIGLWLTTAAIWFNVKNYKEGQQESQD
jgi:hypothetical protein